ncbi:hypothetical protein QFC19_001001 [Naganishia cerealis]|uniref:Uncharacterized protein n=1 Tax=Naganishia cerealis TaxID=610337 RepID=A0ACC2WKE5_9TREE|nr:hypothetical protein QFC19_001001 [Naganishia cerealis]
MSISITEAVPASILQAAKGNIVGGRTLSMPHSTQSGAVSKPESFVSSTQTNVHHNLHEDPSWPLGSEVVTAANTTISAQPPSILSSSDTWRWQSTKEVKPSKISLRSIYRLARSLKAEKGKWNMLAEVTDRIRLALHQMKLLEEVQAEREVAKGEHDKARKNQAAEWKRMTPEQRKEWCNRQIAQDGEEDCTKDEARQEHGQFQPGCSESREPEPETA